MDRPFERLCAGCGEWRPLGWYTRNGSGRLRSRCKTCERPRRVADRAVRRQRVRAASRERITAGDLRRIGEAQGWRCGCGCGRNIRWEYHVDHRVALARGGAHVRGNLQLLSPICNLRKGAR